MSAPVDALPLSGFDPLQPPEATQDVALADVQFNVDADPLTTVAGLAVSDTDGWGGGGTPTATVTVWLISPPGPAQLSVNAVDAASTPVAAAPFTGRAPLQPPEAVQAVAFVVVQARFDCWPATIVPGSAVSVSVGAAGGGATTVTLTVWLVEPPLPVHESV